MISEPPDGPVHRPSDLFDEQPDTQKVRVKRAPRTAAQEIPFMQRLTCTIKEACKVSGLGRTKLYELIDHGALKTSTVGRRRLVHVPSLIENLKL